MRLKTVSFLCLAAACLPGVGWSAWTAGQAWRAWTDASAAVHAAGAMGHALRLVEALAVERGALQERALSAGAGVEDLADLAARNDALLARAARGMERAGLPGDAVTQARAGLVAARAKVAEAVARPPAERDPALVPAMVGDLNGRLNAVQSAIATAEGRAARASSTVGALLVVGGLAVDMRDAAGRRSGVISEWIGGRPLTARQFEDAVRLTGQLHGAWERLQRQVWTVGEPPRLAEAVAATQVDFFTQAEPVYRRMLDLARAGGERPMPLPEWRRWTISALPDTLKARDAAVAEAVAAGEAMAADARRRLAVALAAAGGVVALAAAAAWVLMRRLVLPIQRLTAAVARIAAGDAGTEVPERGREDEIGAMAAALDVFKRNAVELRQTNLRFDAALNNMSQGLAMYNAEERLVVTNDRLCEAVGVPSGSLRPGMTFRAVLAVGQAVGHFAGQTLDEVYEERRVMLAPGVAVVREEARGERWVAVSTRPMAGGGCVVTVEDVTERRRTESRIAHMAHHDALTGLPNRVLFRERLEEALSRARRGGGLAVLCLDLDRFKQVNDTLGHPVGDGLLHQVAARLKAALRDSDTVARLGGDEFAVLQTGVNQPHDAAALARRLVAGLGEAYEVDGHQIVVGASVGIAVPSGDGPDGAAGTGPGEGGSADAVLKHADLALYRAKAEGRAAWRVFEPGMDARLQERRLLELDLRRALAAGEFEVYYQPLVDLRTCRPTGFEALVRWRHPERGMMSPAEFIPLAEEIGLIEPLGEWVLRRACAEAASWPERLKVAVNLSATQFRAGHDLAGTVAGALAASGLAPDRLELEITETAMLHDTQDTLATLHRLRALGVSISMDDFGTGYSSLSYLRRFPFDKVKIDQSFVRDLGGGGGGGNGGGDGGGDCAAIVRAVAALCGSLGMATTAEGVETQAQLDRLAAEGCTEGQGYLFSRPVPAAEVPGLFGRPLGGPPRLAAA